MSGRSLVTEAIDTRPALRRRIVEAAGELIRERGLAGATTREIARAAGCSEGSIYVHFEDKIDLLIAVIVEREPVFAELLELPEKAGGGTVEANLARWAGDLLGLLLENQPLLAALLADRAVFRRFKERVRERGTGPVAVLEAVAAYVRAEQELGRVDAGAAPEVAAALLVGACRDRTLTLSLTDVETTEPSEFARSLARIVVHGLRPAAAQAEPVGETEEPS